MSIWRYLLFTTRNFFNACIKDVLEFRPRPEVPAPSEPVVTLKIFALGDTVQLTIPVLTRHAKVSDILKEVSTKLQEMNNPGMLETFDTLLLTLYRIGAINQGFQRVFPLLARAQILAQSHESCSLLRNPQRGTNIILFETH